MKFKNLIYITFLLAVGLMSAQQTIQGSVSDDTGPLPGVSVLEKGTSNGVVSDFDGNFLITVANSDATLVFSYVGFETQEVSASSDSFDIVFQTFLSTCSASNPSGDRLFVFFDLALSISL